MNPRTSKNNRSRRPAFGAHVSIAGGLNVAAERAVDTGCDCIAIFSASPRVWKRKLPPERDIRTFRNTLHDASIEPIIVHAPYILNIASPDDTLFERSIDLLIFEMEFARLIGSELIVIHPGSHGGRGKGFGYERCVTALEDAFSRFRGADISIALELTAGGGHQICSSFEDAAAILQLSRMQDRLAICIDTCHLFAAGYDIRSHESWESTVSHIESLIDISMIKVMHVNDSKGTLGSHVDRHTHIGEGEIGLRGFRAIVNDQRLRDTPMILETPKGLDNAEDKANLRMLRFLVMETG